MKKTIRLTESDLVRLIKRVIKEQPQLNEPTRYSYGKLDTLRMNLIGRTVTMTGSSTKEKPILKIEDIEADGDLVTFDCSIVNEYGEEKGGLFDAGVGGNIDLTYNCNNNPGKLFKTGREFLAQRNVMLGNETYVNAKLANEIETSYCKSKKEISRIKTDY